MYYILSGRVAVIHKKTHSYIEDLIVMIYSLILFS